MYITHELRTNLKEWRDRLYNTHQDQIDDELNAFWTKINKISPIRSILLELDSQANTLNPNLFKEYQQAMDNLDTLGLILLDRRFKNDRDRIIKTYILLKVLHEQPIEIFVQFLWKYCQKNGNEMHHNFVKMYVEPLINYVYDQLNEGSAVLYLLEKYKKRCEWFYKEYLRNLYEKSNGIQEKVLDDDLRKFLFEQGIDFPFSKPASPSGEADVIGLLHTDDPLVLEVKIFDRKKNYRKDRIIDGFRQIVSYSNDYNKPIGYLLVFNMDVAEVDIVTKQNDNRWPYRVILAGKTYFIMFVNIPPLDTKTASKRGKIDKIVLREEELTSV